VIRGGFILLCFGHFGLYVFDLGSAYQQRGLCLLGCKSEHTLSAVVAMAMYGLPFQLLWFLFSNFAFCVFVKIGQETLSGLIVIDKRIYSAMIIFLCLLIVCLQTHPLYFCTLAVFWVSIHFLT